MDFRLGRESELEKVEEIYERILDEEEAGRALIGWSAASIPLWRRRDPLF